MDIRILVLDDNLNTASTEISQSLSFFVLDSNGPFILGGKSPAMVKLKGVEPPTTLNFTCNPSNNSAHVNGSSSRIGFPVSLIWFYWTITGAKLKVSSLPGNGYCSRRSLHMSKGAAAKSR